eukprot:Rhum_TRINITY_DN14159_c25_g1::Rhum_TRINITY_DN14159_c25_g1_i1::g.71284::m.71284
MQRFESAVLRNTAAAAAAAASGRCRTSSLLRPTSSIFHRPSTAAQQVRLFHQCLSTPAARSLRQTRRASAAPTPPPPGQQPKEAAVEDDEAGMTKKEMRKEVIQAEREAIAELSLYGRMKRYGPTAMLIYLAIHIAGFWLCFFLLMSGIEVRKYLAMIPYFPVLADKKSASDADSFMALFSFLPWAELGLALVINKIFSPLQMLVTISVTPRLAPILLSWGPTKAIVSFLNRLIARVKGTPVPPV